MSTVHRSHAVAAAAPIRPAHVPRWGHLSQTASHYGTVACVLAIYPPDSTDAERRLAEAYRWFSPFTLAGGVVLWVALCASGVSPLLAAVILAGVLLPIGVVLAGRSRGIRRRTVTLSSSRSGLRDDDADERAQHRRLDTLAEALQDAAFACRRGMTSREAFLKTWCAAYTHAAAIAATAARPAR